MSLWWTTLIIVLWQLLLQCSVSHTRTHLLGLTNREYTLLLNVSELSGKLYECGSLTAGVGHVVSLQFLVDHVLQVILLFCLTHHLHHLTSEKTPQLVPLAHIYVLAITCIFLHFSRGAWFTVHCGPCNLRPLIQPTKYGLKLKVVLK